MASSRFKRGSLNDASLNFLIVEKKSYFFANVNFHDWRAKVLQSDVGGQNPTRGDVDFFPPERTEFLMVSAL